MNERTMIDKELKEQNIKTNIDTIMRTTGCKNYSEFSKLLGLDSTQTLYSFLKNPTSNSRVKSAICNYCGITIKQFEETLLGAGDDDLSSTQDVVSAESSIGATADAYDYFIKGTENLMGDLRQLRNELIRSKSMQTTIKVAQAQRKLESGKYAEAIEDYESILDDIRHNPPQDRDAHIYAVLFKGYVNACNHTDDYDKLNELADAFLSDKVRDEQLLYYFLGSLNASNENNIKIIEDALIQLTSKS